MATQNNNNANGGGWAPIHPPSISRRQREKMGPQGMHTPYIDTPMQKSSGDKREGGGWGDEITESKFTPHKHALNKLKESKMEVRGETKHLKLKDNTSPAYPPSLKKKNKKKRKEKVQTQPPNIWKMRGGWRWRGRKTRVELGWRLVASC